MKMNNKELNYILKEIRKANNLSKKAFHYLYKLDEKKFAKTIYRISEINEILTNLEISIEIILGIDEESLNGGKNDEQLQ